MSSAGARAYNGDGGGAPSAGVQGAEPPVGDQGGFAPLKPTKFLYLKQYFSMHLLQLLLLCSGLWFKVRICSLAIAGQHLSIIRQVHGLCLGLTGRLRGKTGYPFLPPLCPLPFVSSLPSLSPPLPSLPLEVGPWIPLRGVGDRCSVIWCIIAIKSVIWWQQF